MKRWLLPVSAIVAMMVVAPARADAPADPSRHRDEARALAEQGLERLDAGDPRAAISLLDQAEAKFHAPTHLLYLARAHAQLGEHVAAATLYAQLVNETLPDYAPDAFREAQRIARAELEPALRRIGTVRVRGSGVEALAVDGKPASGPVLYVTPGRHTVSARAAGGPVERTVEVSAGGVASVDFTPALPARTPPSGGADAPADVGPRPLVVAGIVSMAVGGAAVAAGAITGGLSLVEVDRLDDRCPTKRGCRSEDEVLADRARALGDASTGLFVVGGAAFVTGLVLALVPDEPRDPVAGIRVSPAIGLGSAAVRVAF